MYLKRFFDHNPEEAWKMLQEFSKNSKYTQKKWFNINKERFGKFTLNDIFTFDKKENEDKKVKFLSSSKCKTIDISPLSIIGTYQAPFFDNTLIDILKNEKKSRVMEFFDSSNPKYVQDYFFKDIEVDEPIYISFNDINGIKRYIVATGNHRTLLGSFFQMIDSSFKLKNVTCREYNIDWSKFSKNRFVFWKYHFDYNKFLEKIKI